MEIAEASAFPYCVMYASVCSAILYQHCGRAEDVIVNARRMIAISEEHGFFVQTVGNILLGWATSQVNDPGGVRQGMAAALEGYRMTGACLSQTFYLSLMIDAAICEGAIDDGVDLVNQALQLAEDTGERYWVAALLCQHGELALAAGDTDLAHEKFSAALKRAREQDSKALQVRAAVALHRLPVPASNGAGAAMADALQHIPATNTTPDVVRAREIVASMMTGHGSQSGNAPAE